MNVETIQMGTTLLPKTALSADFARLVQQLSLAEARYLMSYDPREMKSIEQHAAKVIAAYDTARKSYEALIDAGEERQLYDRIDGVVTRYGQLHGQLVMLAQGYQTQAATALFKGGIRQASDLLDDLFSKDIKYNSGKGGEAADRSTVVFHSAFAMTLVASAFMVLVCALVGLGLIRSISAPVAALTAAMRRLAERGMTVIIPGTRRGGEVGVMAAAAEVFKDNMIKADRLTAEQDRIACWPPARPSWKPPPSR